MRAIPLMSTLQQNQLLAAIPEDSRSRLLPYLELVELPHGKVLHEIGDKINHVYFPTDAIVAIVAMLENGDCTEVSMVGNEGVAGISSYMGGDTIPQQAVVRSAGYAYRLPASQLRQEFSRHGEMFTLLLSYTQTLITQTAQIAICNRHHSIEKQLCRVLLQSLDRVHSDELAVTHENLATMLGVRRESITEAAGRMKNLGLIECRRGRVKVQDRSGLEALCCECYRVIRNETERLLPRTASFRRCQQYLRTPSNR